MCPRCPCRFVLSPTAGQRRCPKLDVWRGNVALTLGVRSDLLIPRATMVTHPLGDEDGREWSCDMLADKDRISSHEMSLFSRTTGSPLMQSTFLDAIGVAVQQASVEGKNRWYTSTQELQLVSLGLCRACRDVRTLSVRVTVDSLRSLWRLGHHSLPSTLGSKSLASSRVPSIKSSV